jgi:hypothetical protein
MAKSEWITGFLYVAVLALLPFVGHWARRDAGQTCAFDGSPIEPIYRVQVVDAKGQDRVFCCIGCAQTWLRRQPHAPRFVLVIDEISGTTLDARAAVFVRSLVVTNRVTGNRIHAFRRENDAAEHARAMGGRVLDAAETPLGEYFK